MAYWKSFSINGKSVKTLTLNGKSVKIQGIDHSTHNLRFTMTGGTMGDISVAFDSPLDVKMTVGAFDGTSEAPFAGGTFENTVDVGTKYYLSDVAGIDHLEKGQYYEVYFESIDDSNLPTFNGSTSLDGTYEVTGNLEKSGKNYFEKLFTGDETFTSAELYYGGEWSTYQFASMFENCTALKSFSGNLAHGTTLFEIPASAFESTFEGCTSLKTCSFFSTTGEPVVKERTFARTFFNCTGLESVGMDFVSGTYLGDQWANTECWQCDGTQGYYQCFYNCESLHGLRPVFLAMKNDLDGNYEQMFCRAGLGSSENLFTGPVYVGSASYYENVGYGSYSGFKDVFKDAKVGEIVYPAAFEDDSAFNAASGSPEFGARVTDVTFRDVN